MPKDGFHYFMMDFRQREEAKGNRFSGGKNGLAHIASAHWQKLTREERELYNNYAREDRLDGDGGLLAGAGKLNCMGVSISEMERERREKEANNIAVAEFVEKFVKAKAIDNLKTDEMFLIHVNVFCKTDDDEYYYPAELAICKFNIQDGVLDSYHTFIDPGDIKKGYGFAIKEHSQKSHKIMLADVQGNPDYQDYTKIYNDIIKFIEFGRKKFVPLFTMFDTAGLNTSLKAVEKTLEKLWESKDRNYRVDADGWKEYFPTYPLALLFFHLQNSCCSKMRKDGIAFPNSSSAILELSKDLYNFDDGCAFHQEQDVVMYCSKSYVVRWAQIISDYCRDVLDLTEVTRKDEVKVSNPPVPSLGRKNKSKKNDDDDGKSDDCSWSVASGTSTKSRKTNWSGTSVGFVTAVEQPSSNASQVSHASGTGSAWGGGRGRARLAGIVPPPSNDDDNFPALGGIRRGVRNMKLN